MPVLRKHEVETRLRDAEKEIERLQSPTLAEGAAWMLETAELFIKAVRPLQCGGCASAEDEEANNAK